MVIITITLVVLLFISAMVFILLVATMGQRQQGVLGVHHSYDEIRDYNRLVQTIEKLSEYKEHPWLNELRIQKLEEAKAILVTNKVSFDWSGKVRSK